MSTFVSNAIPGHFYLTKLLLPTLLSTARLSPEGADRVINTASSGHTIVDKIDLGSLTSVKAAVEEFQRYVQYFLSACLGMY